MDYRREIDGLRALAVLPVILFHAGFQTFSGGFVGVDIFFVISGYLITSIIVSELELGTFSLANFYERRARRILPALFLVIAVCLPFAWLWMLPQDLKSFSQSLVAVSLFASNVLFWLTSGYFDTAAELKPLLHTWSLAVEEQYYLVFPVFLLLTWRVGRRWTLGLLAVAFVLSMSLAQWASAAQPVAAFFLLPTRGWELLIGAFVALHLSDEDRWKASAVTKEAGGLIGMALLAYPVFVYDSHTPYPGGYALLPTAGAALIILFAEPATFIGRLLGHRVFVGIGLVSYSAYLWHQPLLAMARHRSVEDPSKWLLGLLVALSVVLAYFSWKFVEMPFRNRRAFSRRTVFSCALAGSMLFMLIGLTGHLSRGFPNRMPELNVLKEIELPLIKSGWCFYSIDTMNDLSPGEMGLACHLGATKSATKGVLFGDSFAAQYEPLWDAAGKSGEFDINSITTNWCFPSLRKAFSGPAATRAKEQCLYNRDYLIGNIAKYDLVVLGGDWGDVLLNDNMAGVLELLDYAASKAKLVVIMPSPKKFDADPMVAYKKSILYKKPFDISKIGSRADLLVTEANGMLKARASKHPNVIYVERDSLFSANGVPSDSTAEGIPYSLEGSHISIYGSRNAARNFQSSDAYSRITRALK